MHADLPGSETSRDRVLTDDELAKVWRADIRKPYCDAVRLLILTGARREEIAALRWDEIKGGAIHLEGNRTKNGKPHIIPLSVPARALLDGIKHNGNYVFTVSGWVPVQNWGRRKRRLMRPVASPAGAFTILGARLPLACRNKV